MPQHAEFVIAAYGVWIVAVGGYFAWMLLRHARARRALRRLERRGG